MCTLQIFKYKKMKPKFLKLSAIILLFSLMGAGCEKEEEKYENITVDYIKCPCDHEANFIKNLEIEDVLLLDASKISFKDMINLSANGNHSLFVCYYPDTDSVMSYSIHAAMMGVGYICNFPNEINEWDIPEKGNYISFSAQEFDLCEQKGAIAANSYANLVLTVLKRKLK